MNKYKLIQQWGVWFADIDGELIPVIAGGTPSAPKPNINDAVTTTESQTVNVVRCPQVNDAVTIAESQTMNVILGPNVNDAVSVVEAIYPLLGIGVSEYIKLNMLLFPSVTESVTVTESVAANLLQVLVQATDSVTITESVSLNMLLFPSVTDSATVTESVTVSIASPTVSISVFDWAMLSNLAQPNEALTVTESVTVNIILMPTVSESVALTESVSVRVVIMPSISESVTVDESAALSIHAGGPPNLINVFDWAMLSNLAQTSDAVTITESVAASIVLASPRLVSASDAIIVHDDGQGVALQGSAGALILILAVDNVGLSKLIIQSDAVTIAESTTLSFSSTGPLQVNVSESVSVTERVWLGPFDYVFVTESVAVYFRQINTVASDVATITELVTLLVQGGTTAPKVQIPVSESLTIAEAFTILLNPILLAVSESVAVSESNNVFEPNLINPVADTTTVDDVVTVQLSKVLLSVAEQVVVDELTSVQFQGVGFINPVQLTCNDSALVDDAFTVNLIISPKPLELVQVSESVSGMPILMPQPFEGVTITESVTTLHPFLALSGSEDVTVIESLELRYSRIPLSVSEDVAVTESAGIGRPFTTWESGAVSVSTWDGNGSDSGAWEPGAVETGAWA